MKDDGGTVATVRRWWCGGEMVVQLAKSGG